MKPITKDSKISVDVRNCTPKQRGLVIDRLCQIAGNVIPDRTDAILDAVLMNLNHPVLDGVSHSTDSRHHNPEVITFNQFLKRANPYAGKEYTIAFDNPKQHKKAQKRLFKMGYAWYDTGRAIEENGSDPITIDDDMDMTNQSTGFITLTYSQFMNMELPEPKAEVSRDELIDTLQNLVNAISGDTIENYKIALADAKGLLQKATS